MKYFNARSALTTAFFVAIAIQIWRANKGKTAGYIKPLGGQKNMTSTFLAFGLLGIAETFISAPLAAIIGWGLVIGLTGKTQPITKGMPSDRRGGGGQSPVTPKTN